MADEVELSSLALLLFPVFLVMLRVTSCYRGDVPSFPSRWFTAAEAYSAFR